MDEALLETILARISAKYGGSSPLRIELIAWGHVLASVNTHTRIIKHSYLESCGATLPVRTRRTCPLRERFADALFLTLHQFGQRAQRIKIAPSKQQFAWKSLSAHQDKMEQTSIQPASTDPSPHDSLPKCSKGVNSSSTSTSCVCSNPTAVIWDCIGSSGPITHIKEIPICLCYSFLNNLRFRDWLHAGGSSKSPAVTERRYLARP
jgi:hypothetical protein